MIKDLKSIDDIANYLRKRGEILKPVKLKAIKSIEEKYNILLPDTYKKFLSLMGNGAGNFMKGSSAFYDEILNLKEWTNELIIDNDLEILPDNAFVFWMHQGYQAAYFKVFENEDPPVYFFSEGVNYPDGFRLTENSLTSFFLEQLSFSYSDI